VLLPEASLALNGFAPVPFLVVAVSRCSLCWLSHRFQGLGRLGSGFFSPAVVFQSVPVAASGFAARCV